MNKMADRSWILPVRNFFATRRMPAGRGFSCPMPPTDTGLRGTCDFSIFLSPWQLGETLNPYPLKPLNSNVVCFANSSLFRIQREAKMPFVAG